MRISDWSSDVCSSDLGRARRLRAAIGYRVRLHRRLRLGRTEAAMASPARLGRDDHRDRDDRARHRSGYAIDPHPDRKGVEKGKSVSVRVDLGGLSIIQTKKK